MISFTDAIDTIHHTIKPLSPEIKPISDGLGLVLAEDIFSPIDIPGFNQSAMDGYAIKLGDDKVKNAYVIGGEVAAGEQPAQYIENHNSLIPEAQNYVDKILKLI